MKKRALIMAVCGMLTASFTFAAFNPVQVHADDWDEWGDWDDWDYYWDDVDDDDFETIVIEDWLREEERREREKERRREEKRRQKEEERRRQEEEERRRREEEEERRRREEEEKKKRVTGIRVSTNSITLTVGATTQVGVQVQPENANNRGVTLTSSNPSVATVDMYANIRANSPGTAVITARTNENGYAADIYVTVTGAAAPAAPVQTASVRDSAFCAQAAAQILGAAPGGTVNLPSMTPMSFDTNVANAMLARPDVTVSTAFPYQGHTYVMTLAAGYNLSSRLDNAGFADWTSLFAISSSDPMITAAAIN